jgi:hypothetical protein
VGSRVAIDHLTTRVAAIGQAEGDPVAALRSVVDHPDSPDQRRLEAAGRRLCELMHGAGESLAATGGALREAASTYRAHREWLSARLAPEVLARIEVGALRLRAVHRADATAEMRRRYPGEVRDA